MVAPLLIGDFNSTDSDRIHQVYVMTGTDLEPLGDDIDESASAQFFGDTLYQNMVIAAWGSVYAVGEEGLFRLTNGSLGDWSRDSADGGYTYPIPGGANTRTIGVYFTSIGNIPYLFGTYTTGNTTSRVWRLNLLTGIGEDGANDANPGEETQYFYDGQVFSAQDGLLSVTDPSSFTITDIPTPGGSDDPNSVYREGVVAFNEFNGKLYMLGQAHGTGSTSLGLPTLYEYGAGQFTAIANNFEVTNRIYAQIGTRWALFDDGTRMYAIYWNEETGNNGWKMFQLDFTGGTFVVGTELTNTVLPAALRPGNGALDSGRWSTYIDQKNDGTYDIFLNYGTSSTGGAITQYQFVDNTTELTYIQSGADARFAMPESKTGGGERTVDLSAPSVCVYSRERNLGGETVTFRAFPPILPLDGYDPTDHVVNFYFGLDQDVPVSQALLTGTATGGSAVRVGNSVTAVEADGVTDYTITIQAFGFNDLDKINLVAEIS